MSAQYERLRQREQRAEEFLSLDPISKVILITLKIFDKPGRRVSLLYRKLDKERNRKSNKKIYGKTKDTSKNKTYRHYPVQVIHTYAMSVHQDKSKNPQNKSLKDEQLSVEASGLDSSSSLFSDFSHNLSTKRCQLYFIFEDMTTSLFYAIFSYTQFPNYLKQSLREVPGLQYVSLEPVTIAYLFITMANMEFREYQLFHRMTCCKKEKLRESQNPFAQAIYEKTVYHIRNYRDKLEKVLDQFAEYLLAEEQFKNHNVIDAMLQQRKRYGKKTLENQIHWVTENEEYPKVKEGINKNRKEILKLKQTFKFENSFGIMKDEEREMIEAIQSFSKMQIEQRDFGDMDMNLKGRRNPNSDDERSYDYSDSDSYSSSSSGSSQTGKTKKWK